MAGEAERARVKTIRMILTHASGRSTTSSWTKPMDIVGLLRSDGLIADLLAEYQEKSGAVAATFEVENGFGLKRKTWDGAPFETLKNSTLSVADTLRLVRAAPQS